MSRTTRTAATGTAAPNTSATPPTSSTIAANQADTVGSGTPDWSKKALVPLMPLATSFCQPCANKMTPRITTDQQGEVGERGRHGHDEGLSGRDVTGWSTARARAGAAVGRVTGRRRPSGSLRTWTRLHG